MDPSVTLVCRTEPLGQHSPSLTVVTGASSSICMAAL
jgi:hypothetical protein